MNKIKRSQFQFGPFWDIFSSVRSSDIFSPLSWISCIIQNHQYISCSFICSPLSWNHRSFIITNPFLFLYLAVCLPCGELSVRFSEESSKVKRNRGQLIMGGHITCVQCWFEIGGRRRIECLPGDWVGEKMEEGSDLDNRKISWCPWGIGTINLGSGMLLR